MRKKHIIFTIIGIVIILGLTFLWYSGFFTKIKIEEKEIQPMTFVGIERYGDYSENLRIIDSIKKEIQKKDIKINETFCIYYDKAEETAPENQHSIIGCILDPEYENKIIQLKREQWLIQNFGKTKCMYVEFPNRNNYSLHAAKSKIYHAIEEHSKSNGYKLLPNGKNGILEIYTDQKIEFCVEIIY